MDSVKEMLNNLPALKVIDYSLDAGEVILGVDVSINGYGGNLNQSSVEDKSK